MGLGVEGVRANLKTEYTLVIISLLLMGCSKSEPPLPTTDAGAGSGFADQELFGAVIRLTQEDLPRLTLRAPHLSRFDDKRLLDLEGGVQADFFDNFGRHRAVLTSETGEIIEGINRLTAKGHVVVKSDSGLVLRSEELHYEEAIGKIQSDGFVTMVSPQDSLSGYGFSSDPDLTNWEIKNSSGATWRKMERNRTSADTTH